MNLLESIISETGTPVNRYLLVGDIGSPYGVLFLFPVFRDGGVEEALKELSKTPGMEIKDEIVTDVIIGRLCFRKFDNSYSKQNATLAGKFGRKPMLKEEYF